MRILAGLLVLSLLLAGCSGGDGGGAAPPAASASTTTTAAPPPPVPTTDTLHFLQAPEMSPLPPTGATVRTPVTVGGFDGQDAPQGAQWRHQVATAGNVTGGEVRIWVEVLETMLHFPSTPLQESCTWQLLAEVGIGGGAQPACINEPAGPISPGIKELVFPLVFQGPVSLAANETVTVTLLRGAFSPSANNAVDALSGSAERDSRIQLRGLAEPVVP